MSRAHTTGSQCAGVTALRGASRRAPENPDESQPQSADARSGIPSEKTQRAEGVASFRPSHSSVLESLSSRGRFPLEFTMA